MLDVVEALGHVNLAARDEVYHACRALLVHRPEQLGIFDRVFAAFWRAHHAPTLQGMRHRISRRTSADAIEIMLALEEPTSEPAMSEGDAPTPETGREDLERSGRTGRQGFRGVHG